MSLFDEIRAALKRHCITQGEFAVMAGIPETYMSTIMRRQKDLRMSTVRKIRATLDRLEQEARA